MPSIIVCNIHNGKSNTENELITVSGREALASSPCSTYGLVLLLVRSIQTFSQIVYFRNIQGKRPSSTCHRNCAREHVTDKEEPKRNTGQQLPARNTPHSTWGQNRSCGSHISKHEACQGASYQPPGEAKAMRHLRLQTEEDPSC